MNKSSVRQIFLLWICWATILLGFQKYLNARIPDNTFQKPDKTRLPEIKIEPYLSEPFLNEMVAWDSEYFLSISIKGYDDPASGYVLVDNLPSKITRNYARQPLYPALIRLFSKPLSILGLNPIATATLAGVLIALLGTLAGMIALFNLAFPFLGEDGAYRAVFFLLIYPAGFYLAQVYAEGLFIGCAFTSLALMQHGHKGNRYLWLASIFALLAILTRAVGIALVPAIFISQFIPPNKSFDKRWGFGFSPLKIPWKSIMDGTKYAALPTIGYLAWSFSPLGERFRFVMENFFGSKTLGIIPTIIRWIAVLQVMLGRIESALPDPGHTVAYYLIQICTLLLALIAGIWFLRKQVPAAVFSLGSLAICLFTSLPYGFPRYSLAMPAVFLFLSQLGKNKTFDKAWTIASLLLMGLMTTLFTLDLWVD